MAKAKSLTERVNDLEKKFESFGEAVRELLKEGRTVNHHHYHPAPQPQVPLYPSWINGVPTIMDSGNYQVTG